ncbi:uncharacterized protein [Amphiura filiformis]|uniref:uncharacterized protein n=1 Tax=Amphiura filiformis TaxID=82378 RepID=UPI003B222210
MWLKSIEYKLRVVNFAAVHGVSAAAVCCQLDKELVMEWTKDEAVFRELSGSSEKKSKETLGLYSDIDSDTSVKELPESAEINKGSSSHKGQRLKSYTIEFKLQAVDYAKDHSVAATAKAFGVDNKQVRYWRQQEEKLRSTSGTGKRILKGQGRPFEYPQIDTELASWVIERKSQGFNITAKALRWKGKQVHMQKGDVNFAASQGWLNSFCRRHNVVLTKRKHNRKKQDVPTTYRPQPSALIFPRKISVADQNLGDRPQASLYGLQTSPPMQKYVIDGQAPAHIQKFMDSSTSFMPTGS